MNNILLRSILVGLLLGAALFIMPFFLLRLVLFLVLISVLFRLFGGGRSWRGGWGWRQNYTPAFTDRIRQMSDEEYAQFKQRYAPFGRGEYAEPKSSENPTGEKPTTI